MKVEVEQGQCRINSYTTIVDEDNVKVFYFDAHDKYPKWWAAAGRGLLVELDEHSPSYKSRKNFDKTHIEFETNNEWDIVEGSTGRYSLYVTLFKKNCWDGADERGEWFEK